MVERSTQVAVEPEPILPDHDDDAMNEVMSSMTAEERADLGLPEPAQVTEPVVPPEPTPATEPAPEPTTPPEPTPKPVPAAAAEPQPAPDPATPPEPKEPGDGPTVPLPRFNEVAHERNRARESLAFQMGQNAVLKRQIEAGLVAQAPTPAQPTFEDRLSEIDTNATKLEHDFEQGDQMTTADFMRQSKALERQRTDVLLEQAKQTSEPTPAQTPKPQSPNDDAFLEAKTQDLEVQHPYLTLLSDGDIDMLGQRVLVDANAEGKPIDTRTATGLLNWRTGVARLSDKWGQILTGKQLPAKQPAAPGAQPPAPSAQALARDAKIELQAQMPPDVSNLGRGADKVGLQGADLVALATTNPAALEDIPSAELEKITQS